MIEYKVCKFLEQEDSSGDGWLVVGTTEEGQARLTSSSMREDLGHPSTLRVRGGLGPGSVSEQGPFSRGLLSPRQTLANFCQGCLRVGLGPTCLLR